VIPKVLPPLTGLTVLVTRPASQGSSLCEHIIRRGGVALAFPAIEIEPVACDATPAAGHDLVVFLSANAVTYGARYVQKGANTRVAAIGRATAAALKEVQLPADIVPETGFTSEALLSHPGMDLSSGARVLIVRGQGGRELLQETLSARGAVTESLEVYRRVRPGVDERARAAVEERWLDEGIDVVTLTSVETLNNLLAMLSERGRALLASTPVLVPSRRIVDAAAAAGLTGGAILAPGADDESMIGALAAWRARGRSR
jgi:uroporphyrinogen-III synthase